MASPGPNQLPPTIMPYSDSHDFDYQQLLLGVQQYNAEHPDHALPSDSLGPVTFEPFPNVRRDGDPVKPSSQQASPTLQVDSSFLENVNIQAPSGVLSTGSPSKKPATIPVSAGPALVQQPMFSTFSTTKPAAAAGEHPKSGEPSSTKAGSAKPNPSTILGKRSHPGQPSASSRERGPSKLFPVREEEPAHVPDPENMPPVVDEGGKPPYSYAQLIGMAILRGKRRRMTLAQIYKWITDTFEHYRSPPSGWQNSIRHNLSLNKAFVKFERPRNVPGKGNFWTIAKGHEHLFLHDKPHRKPIVCGTYAPYVDPAPRDTSQLQPTAADSCLPPPAKRRALDTSQLAADQDVSSDGTIADPSMAEAQDPVMPPPRRAIPMAFSPEPEIHSSPPVPRHASRHDTSPLGIGAPVNRSEDNKGQINAFKDSGFYSSIESSVPRRQHVGPGYLTSEAGNRSSVLKRGRAEEEIARMRSSSIDHSPSKASKRPRLAKPGPSSTVNSSSPARPVQMHFAPLTPAAPASKAFARPPPTVSPGTLLQRHRESVRDLVGTPGQILLGKKSGTPFAFADTHDAPMRFSPLKGYTHVNFEHAGPNSSPLRPAFVGLPDLTFDNTFDDVTDEDTDKWNAFFNSGSPVARKPSAARPAAMRAHTSTGILGDITNSSRKNMRLASPFRMTSSAAGHDKSRSMSPVKKPGLKESVKSDAFFGCGGSSDTENDDPFGPSPDDGMDLLKGFRSIGSGVDKENAPHHSQRPNSSDKTKRPVLGRTLTNAF